MRVYVSGIRGEQDYRSFVDERSDGRCVEALVEYLAERRAHHPDSTQDDSMLREALTVLCD